MEKPGNGMQMFHEQVHDRTQWRVAIEERKELVREAKRKGLKLNKPHEMQLGILRSIVEKAADKNEKHCNRRSKGNG